MMTARLEKRDFKRIFLLFDILVVAIFAVSLVMLARDAYIAGFYEGRSLELHNAAFWAMMRDSALIAGSLSWIFYRYFRSLVAAMVNPWS